MKTALLSLLVLASFASVRGETNAWFWSIPVDELWLNVAAAPVIVVGHSADAEPKDGATNTPDGAFSLVVDHVLKGSPVESTIPVFGCPDSCFGCGTTNVYFLEPSLFPSEELSSAMDLFPFGPVPFSDATRLLVSEEIARQRADLDRLRAIVPESAVPGLGEIRNLVSQLESDWNSGNDVVPKLTERCFFNPQAILFVLSERFSSGPPPPERLPLEIMVPNSFPSLGAIKESHRIYSANSISEMLLILADCGIGCGRFFWFFRGDMLSPRCDIDEARRWFAGTFLVRWASRMALQGAWPVPVFVARFRVPETGALEELHSQSRDDGDCSAP